MSRENVEIVRQALDAYTHRDVERLRELNAAGVELDWSRSRSWLAGVYRGIDESLRFYAGYFDAFDEIAFHADCFVHTRDVVVVPNVAHQRGRDGIVVSARSTLVFTVRDARIVHICLYQDADEALAAVGLAR